MKKTTDYIHRLFISCPWEGILDKLPSLLTIASLRIYGTTIDFLDYHVVSWLGDLSCGESVVLFCLGLPLTSYFTISEI